jgi:hypothetical protein
MTLVFDLSTERPLADNLNGAVIYEGPSQIDGKPIVAIATGIKRPSTNDKTGPMIQIVIIRADIKPLEATQTGEDSSVCGDCKCRGELVEVLKSSVSVIKNVDRVCYVNLGNSVRGIFECFARGGYPKPSDGGVALCTDKELRFGAYGDPVAVPLSVWKRLLKVCSKHTGYTHQWKRPEYLPYAEFLMASADSPAERMVAKIYGWRTFRVKTESDPIEPGEIYCPGTEKAKKQIQCIDCVLCSGNKISAKDIVLDVHGIAPKVIAFNKLRTKMEGGAHGNS